MAIVKPFRGIRPPKDLVEKVESRPYDVLDSEEARIEAGDNEMSLYRIIKPEINFEPGTSEYDPRVYVKAAENFQMFQDKGWLVQDDKEQYYIYAQTMNGKTQYGLVVGAYVNDYMTGVIKKQERTRQRYFSLNGERRSAECDCLILSSDAISPHPLVEMLGDALCCHTTGI